MKDKIFSEKQQGLMKNLFGMTSKTSSRTEIIAGITTFITMAYILIIIPLTISEPYAIMGDGAMAEKVANASFIGTCLAAFVGTFLVSIYAKLPFALAPGMGLSAFLAYTVILGMGYTYNQALVIVFISGILFIFLTAIGLREAIIDAIPTSIKNAMTPGIGLFITIIGLKSAGIIVGNDATLLAMVDFSKWSDPNIDTTLVKSALIAFIGLIIIGVLNYKNIRGSILIGIVITTIIGIPLGLTNIEAFDFNIGVKFKDFFDVSFFNLDFRSLFSGGDIFRNLFTIFMLVISFSLVHMFDSLGTLLGASKQGNMLDENGNVKNLRKTLMSDAIATSIGALIGTSTVTTVVESSAGIAEGGRSGLTSFTTAMLFLLALVFAPFVNIIPLAATAPALIYVGILMMSNIKDVDFSNPTDVIPAFITITFMPFTYSIANGIAMGLISYCLLKAFSGKVKEISPLTAIIAMIFVLRYFCITTG